MIIKGRIARNLSKLFIRKFKKYEKITKKFFGLIITQRWLKKNIYYNKLWIDVKLDCEVGGSNGKVWSDIHLISNCDPHLGK